MLYWQENWKIRGHFRWWIRRNSYRVSNKTRLTISSHSNLNAFLESAVLTLCSVLAVDATISRGFTSIRQLIANSSVEETLAPLTSEDAIVTTRWRRVTNGAIDRLFWVIVPINLMKLRPGHNFFFLGLRTSSLSARPFRITHPDFGGELSVT